MIFDTIGHAGLYKGISAHLDKALDCMMNTDFDKLEAGRYEVDGDNVYYMVQEPILKKPENTKWEAHRRYIDIQYGLADGEEIGYAPLDEIGAWEDYNETKDILLSYEETRGAMLPLNKGMFAILFPQDAHRPCEKASGAPEMGRKVVFKVQVEG